MFSFLCFLMINQFVCSITSSMLSKKETLARAEEISPQSQNVMSYVSLELIINLPATNFHFRLSGEGINETIMK